MGYQISLDDIEDDIIDPSGTIPADDKFVWTYISPEFPMAQVDIYYFYSELSLKNYHHHFFYLLLDM